MNNTSKIIITVASLATVAAIVGGFYIHVFRGRSVRIGGSSKTLTGEGKLDGMPSDLEIDIDSANMTVCSGTDFSIRYSLPENMVPNIDFHNGRLSVKSPDNILIVPFDMGGDYYVNITLPQNAGLNTASIDLDAGNLNISDISGDQMKIDLDAGNLNMADTKVNGLSIDLDAGNMELTGCMLQRFQTDVDAGNIDLAGCDVQSIKAKADAGNISSRDSRIAEGSCETDMGNITLSGDIGNVSTKTDLGKVSVD